MFVCTLIPREGVKGSIKFYKFYKIKRKLKFLFKYIIVCTKSFPLSEIASSRCNPFFKGIFISKKQIKISQMMIKLEPWQYNGVHCQVQRKALFLHCMETGCGGQCGYYYQGGHVTIQASKGG